MTRDDYLELVGDLAGMPPDDVAPAALLVGELGLDSMAIAELSVALIPDAVLAGELLRDYDWDIATVDGTFAALTTDGARPS